MRRVDFENTYVPYGMEMVAYQNAYKTVLYVASRNYETTNLKMDLRGFFNVLNMEAVILGYDRTSSDGLNEMADNTGSNRVDKRTINEDEYNKLNNLGFLTKPTQITSRSAHHRMVKPHIKPISPKLTTSSHLNGEPQNLRTFILRLKPTSRVNWNSSANRN